MEEGRTKVLSDGRVTRQAAGGVSSWAATGCSRLILEVAGAGPICADTSTAIEDNITAVNERGRSIGSPLMILRRLYADRRLAKESVNKRLSATPNSRKLVVSDNCCEQGLSLAISF